MRVILSDRIRELRLLLNDLRLDTTLNRGVGEDYLREKQLMDLLELNERIYKNIYKRE